MTTTPTSSRSGWITGILVTAVIALALITLNERFERKLAQRSLGEALETLQDQDHALAECRRSQGKSEPMFSPIGPIPHVNVRTSQYDNEPVSWFDWFRPNWLQ